MSTVAVKDKIEYTVALESKWDAKKITMETELWKAVKKRKQNLHIAYSSANRTLEAIAKKKVLYLADRNNLVDQSIQQDFKPLEKVIHKINFQKEDKSKITAHQVYFALYQQLDGAKRKSEDDEETDEEIENEISKYLKQTDRMSKTIVFCPTEDAAERMRLALNNLNTDMLLRDAQGNVKEQYVVRITGSDKYGKAAREVINALLDKYAELGIYDIESTEILKQNPFTKYGKPSRIAALFGGTEKYREALREIENELYKGHKWEQKN